VRRFPPPWSVEEQDACFVVNDGAGQKLAYVYFEDEPGRRSAAKLLRRKSRCVDGSVSIAVGVVAEAVIRASIVSPDDLTLVVDPQCHSPGG
jgi:hypothetical protein